MNEKEYFYVVEGNKKGPFSLEELKKVKLSKDTLIWYHGLDNWAQLKDITGLFELLDQKKVPPPIPNKNKDISEKPFYQETRNTTIENKSETSEKVMPFQKSIQLLLIWIGVNLFALITSYSEIKFFNRHSPRTDAFWPFVEFIKKKYTVEGPPVFWPAEVARGNYTTEFVFNGLFYRYDWSEFLIYVGGALLLYLLINISKLKKMT